MAVVKGKYKGIDIAENGSSVKIRTAEGSSIRLDTEDLEALAEDVVAALVAAKLRNTGNPGGAPNRYQVAPPVVNASDVNVNYKPGVDAFSIEASDDNGRRVIAILKPEHVRFLIDVYQKTRSISASQNLQ